MKCYSFVRNHYFPYFSEFLDPPPPHQLSSSSIFQMQTDFSRDRTFKVQGSRFKVQGSRFKVQGSRFKVQGSCFKVQSSKLKFKVQVQSSRFK